MEIKKILVPVDSSKYSEKAVSYAAEFSEKMGCSVILLHSHPKYPSYLGEPFLQEAVNRINEKAEMVMKPLRESLLKREINFKELFLEEPVGEAVAETARIENADMIIMGTKGKSDLEGLIMGSVTHKVIHLAHCPVMVIR